MSCHSGTTAVVVVGAGPVGLLLAGDLGRAGVPVVIVERLARPMTESRASQLTSRTAELLDARGCGSLLAEATHEPRAHFAGIGVDVHGVDSERAGNWKVPQHRTEAVLAERTADAGVQLLRAETLVELTSDADRVVCGLRDHGGRRTTIAAQYVVGCDGADSTVRRLAGFAVSRTPATCELLRADVTGVQIRDRRFERLPRGFAVAATRNGVTRVMVRMHGRDVTARRGSPEFAEIVAHWRAVTGEDIGGGHPVWVDAFDNSSGHVSRYRCGRVLLAGDAAHWHLPIGGQALNVGLQDAADLGPRLARVVLDGADPQRLDAYHRSRHPAAARVLSWVAAQEQLLLGGPSFDPMNAVVRELAALPVVQAHLAAVLSNAGSPAERSSRALV